MSDRIRLITRGDDAGSARSANRAIRACFERGVLRNASVMGVGPAVEDAAAVLGGLKGLCVGLHVALNCEWEHPRFGPVLPPERVLGLVDGEGNLTYAPQDLATRSCPLEEMVAEVKAQLARLRGLGLAVAYLDQHMGVGWVGGLNEALADLCRQEGLINADQTFAHLPRAAAPSETRWDDLRQRLEAASGTYVVVTQPCFADAEMKTYHFPGQAEGIVAAERDEDRRLLCLPELLAYGAQQGVEFARFSDCV